MTSCDLFNVIEGAARVTFIVDVIVGLGFVTAFVYGFWVGGRE